MAQVGGAIRRTPPRLEVPLPLPGSAGVAFGLVLRRPRRRRRKRSALKQWTRVVTTAACCVIAAVIPIWTVIAAPELERLGAVALAKPTSPLVAMSPIDSVERAAVVARRAPMTALRKDPPGLPVHAVAPGETVRSIDTLTRPAPPNVAY